MLISLITSRHEEPGYYRCCCERVYLIPGNLFYFAMSDGAANGPRPRRVASAHVVGYRMVVITGQRP